MFLVANGRSEWLVGRSMPSILEMLYISYLVLTELYSWAVAAQIQFAYNPKLRHRGFRPQYCVIFNVFFFPTHLFNKRHILLRFRISSVTSFRFLEKLPLADDIFLIKCHIYLCPYFLF